MFSLNELLNMSVVMLAFREIASIFLAGLPYGLFEGYSLNIGRLSSPMGFSEAHPSSFRLFAEIWLYRFIGFSGLERRD